MFNLLGADNDLGHIAHVNRSAIARCKEQKSDVGNALQGLTSNNRHTLVAVADAASKKGAIGLFDLFRKLRERDAMQ